jgi:hypothetical protein
MSREVRKVPKDWQHPKSEDGKFIPLFDGKALRRLQEEWDIHEAKWKEGLRDDWRGEWKAREGDEKSMSFEEWFGPRPSPENYMPDWPDEERTHLMMYESTSEGTPISPAFETPEELARWLTDNDAFVFEHWTTTYEQWLSTCKEREVLFRVYGADEHKEGVESSTERDNV